MTDREECARCGVVGPVDVACVGCAPFLVGDTDERATRSRGAVMEPFVPLPYTFEPEASAIPLAANHPGFPDGSSERFRVVEGMTDAERGYIVATWTDSFHRAKANFKLPIGAWKGGHRDSIERVFDLPGTRVLVARHETARAQRRDDGADLGPAVLGWLVWTSGRGWPAAHYAFTRFALAGEKWQRRGVMTALVDAAELGSRVSYTHKGEHARGSRWSRQFHPRPLDEEIAAWARRRGTAAGYVPLADWIRGQAA